MRKGHGNIISRCGNISNICHYTKLNDIGEAATISSALSYVNLQIIVPMAAMNGMIHFRQSIKLLQVRK
uniref:Uncharacterized protein n=1 Tax=Arion vulgaris TaxID=1028688 RepID=A0A0B7A949_9EUPU